MSFYDALEIILEESNAVEALALLLALFFVYYRLFQRRFGSIFDPLVYVLTLSAVSVAFLLLMGLHGLVSIGKLAYVIGALGLFYLGFLATDFSTRRANVSRWPGNFPMRPVRSATLAILFCSQFVVLTITYVFFGVPLFLESRLAQFVDSGGFGVLGRLAIGLEFSTLVLAFIVLRQRSAAGAWAKAILIQFVVSAVLSGSKGSLLAGLFAWYLSLAYANHGWPTRVPLPQLIVGLLALTVVAPLLVISVQNADAAAGLAAVFRLLAIRIAAEGDAYAYFLGGDLIDTIARHDWMAPLRPVLAAFRLVPAESAINPGFEIVREVLSVDVPSTGPNSRLPIYILYFYGPAGIFLAPILGATLGWIRNRVVQTGRSSPLRFALVAAVYFHVCKLEVDVQLTVAGLFGLALALPIFAVAAAAGGVRGRPAERRQGPLPVLLRGAATPGSPARPL